MAGNKKKTKKQKKDLTEKSQRQEEKEVQYWISFPKHFEATNRGDPGWSSGLECYTLDQEVCSPNLAVSIFLLELALDCLMPQNPWKKCKI